MRQRRGRFPGDAEKNCYGMKKLFFLLMLAGAVSCGKAPQELTVITDGRDMKRLPLPFDATGYEYEVREFARTAEAGGLECPSLPAAAFLCSD